MTRRQQLEAITLTTIQVLEVPQGFGQELETTPLSDAVASFTKWDADFLEQFPQCRQYHRPRWRVMDVPPDHKAPWGTEWYVVDAGGLLHFHSADIDSSG